MLIFGHSPSASGRGACVVDASVQGHPVRPIGGSGKSASVMFAPDTISLTARLRGCASLIPAQAGEVFHRTRLPTVHPS
jgi:hypothetical protein